MFFLFKQPLLLILPTPYNIIIRERAHEDSQRQGTTPPDDRVPKEVDLDLVIEPSVHPESDRQERPLTGVRGEVVVLVRVLGESVVGFHHGDVEVDKVLPEV